LDINLADIKEEAVYRPFGIFRFLLALMVLVQHGLVLLPFGDRDFFYDLELGVLAVFTFFAISGFIVAEANSTFYFGRPVPFLLNRALRLVPPYLAALLLVIVVQGVLYHAGRRVSLDTALAGSPWSARAILSGVLDIVPGYQSRFLIHQEFSFVPFAWTLRVEFLFYIAAFITWATLARAGAKVRLTVAYAMLGTGYLLFFFYLGRSYSLPSQFGFIPFFLFGLAIFFLWRRRNPINACHVVFAAACIFVAMPYIKQRGHPILEYQIPILASLLLVLFRLAFVARVGSRFKKWDKRLGDLSYPLYVNHGTILLVLLGTIPSYPALSYALAIPLSIALATLMNLIVEKPIRGIRDRLRGRSL
jgi:peptidoglycan/LPS O-acetylase OafA/YrhL